MSINQPPSPLEGRVRRLMSDNRERTSADVARALNESTATVGYQLSKLATAGELTRDASETISIWRRTQP